MWIRFTRIVQEQRKEGVDWWVVAGWLHKVEDGDVGSEGFSSRVSRSVISTLNYAG